MYILLVLNQLSRIHKNIDYILKYKMSNDIMYRHIHFIGKLSIIYSNKLKKIYLH